ncbi:hypothetical protein HBB16_06545 [Pseudonocardia sp. MCCB 268]|nr:hypothetical protein [Pseudonocardia cytotoxica]
MVMSLCSLLEAHPDPDEQDVREALTGNICRCTGYQKIIDAALSAAGNPAGVTVMSPHTDNGAATRTIGRCGCAAPTATPRSAALIYG